jgi:hypothetical protein
MASASEAAIDIPVLLREQEARGCLTAHVTATRLQRRRLLLWSAHPKRIPTPVSQALLTIVHFDAGPRPSPFMRR